MKTVNRIRGDLPRDQGESEYSDAVRRSWKNQKSPRSRKTAMIIPDDYMTLIDRNYVFEFVSDKYCSTLGKAKQDVVNSPVAHVWGQEIFYEIIKKCLDGCFAGEEVHYEGWMEFPGRGRRYYQVFHHPYTNELGEITHAAVALRDITGPKNEEEALRKSESHFREVLKSMHFGVCSFDTAGRFTFVNDVVVERTGYSLEWFLCKSLSEFVRPEQRDEILKHLETSLLGVSLPPYEFAYYKATGETSWVHVNMAPIWEKGRVVGVLGVLLDITKRKKSEYALLESEEKYRRLFEDSRDAIFITDRRGRLTDANASFLNLFGYEKEEAIGLNVIDLYVNHDDRGSCVKAMNGNGFVRDYQLKLKKKDGTATDFLLTGTARQDGSGAILSYQGILRDESEQKMTLEALHESEHTLRSLIDGSPIPQFVIDRNHTVTHWNRALEMISGIKAEDVKGTNRHWSAFYPVERPCVADLLIDENEAQIPDWYNGDDSKVDLVSGGYRVIHFFPDLGEEGKWFQFTTAAIRDSGGNVMGAVETVIDITEHRLTEDMIQKTEERCRRILEVVSQGGSDLFKQ